MQRNINNGNPTRKNHPMIEIMIEGVSASTKLLLPKYPVYFPNSSGNQMNPRGNTRPLMILKT
jgi:hypothetical protein